MSDHSSAKYALKLRDKVFSTYLKKLFELEMKHSSDDEITVWDFGKEFNRVIELLDSCSFTWPSSDDFNEAESLDSSNILGVLNLLMKLRSFNAEVLNNLTGTFNL